VEIQTDVTGNNVEGYKLAERHAHSWFFVNYDRSFGVQHMNPAIVAQIAVGLTQDAIEAGNLDPYWLECPHPQISLVRPSPGNQPYGNGADLGVRF